MSEFQPQPQQNGKGAGIAGLVLGIIACVFMFIPLIGWIGTICGIIGIVLSAVGRKQGAGGVATAGLVLSIIATALTLIFFLACAACVAGIAAL